MVDQVANFKKVTVSTGYNNTATSIVLATGQGAELPDPSGDNYNVVWWDSTNYPDPADDPNVEVVRVTAKSTDTLTVTRNQESSGASNKNNADATYKMHLGVTAKTIADVIAIENATGMEDQSFTNLLDNSNFDAWTNGITSADPDKWSHSHSPTINREATIIKKGLYSAKLTHTSICSLYQSIPRHTEYRNRAITLYAWTWCAAANTAKIRINDNIGNTVSSYHTGGSGWELLKVTRTIDGSAAALKAELQIDISGTAYFSGVIMVEGSIGSAYNPKPLSASDLTIHLQTPQTLTGAGAVDIITDITHIVTTGADALTLVDGAEGQEKFIIMKTDANDGTLTPSNLGNGTTITFDDVGDSAHLLFTNGAWHFMGGTATLA